MQRTTRLIFSIVLLATLVSGWGAAPSPQTVAQTGTDLYIKDTPLDTGIEPNPDTGPMWATEDVWVRKDPDPNYQPYPFPEGSPSWTPLPNESAEYRDPKYGLPNYVYVRVRNRGTVASTGTERLKVYWAKASTGLSWPTQWVDYLATNCGPTGLYGSEMTKPRRNAATATAAERAAYVQAIVDIGASGAPVFPDAVSYWHKQNDVHDQGPANRHATPAFLPWHREFINRYEALLQEANPTVKLLYWDWTTDPENSTGGFNFFTSSFMGASGRGAGSVSAGAPFIPALSPPSITRDLSNSTTPPPNPDSSILANGTYPSFRSVIENVPNHNSAHGYIGGVGNMSWTNLAAQDPFFFLLHGNVDRLWAQWQRNPASVARLDAATTYGANSSNINITSSMGPWDGSGPAISPWTVADGYIVSKTAKDPSVVSPPIYDTAPLVIPPLQPGEAAVIQIPWYPPNPANFACFGGDQTHFCLMARIETSTSPPYGMTFAETTDINLNTRNNNNIVWKNISVVDNFAGALRTSSVIVRNVFRQRVQGGLRFANVRDATSFFNHGNILVDLKPTLFQRWREGGGAGQGVTAVGGTTLRITSPDAVINNLRLEPDEMFSIDVRFELAKGYQAPRDLVPKWDLIQIGAPGNPNALVGGQRYELQFQKLVPVKAGSEWRYLSNGAYPGAKWAAPDFVDDDWKLGRAELGFGDNQITLIDGGPASRRYTTAYFRHAFDVADPSFFRSLLLRLKRDDGAVVYLNGSEIYRSNLPAGAITHDTLATREVSGLEEDVFFPVTVPVDRLRQGRNVIAVEVHQASLSSPDLSFDLELAANPTSTTFAPNVAFATPTAGGLFQLNQPIPITVDALDSDGQIASVALFADGRQIGVDTQAPYTFQWQGATLGAHRLRAVATDSAQQQAAVEQTISVVDNTPPAATLTAPANGAVFPANTTIRVAAQASDTAGAVQQVEFYLHEGTLFSTPQRLVGTVAASPYTIDLSGLAPGHYMLTAVAKDNRGETSVSFPAHFMVQAAGKQAQPTQTTRPADPAAHHHAH